MHCPDTTGTGIGTEAAGDAFRIIGDILVRGLESGDLSDHTLGFQIPPADRTGRADGLAQMAVTAGGAGKTTVGLIVLGRLEIARNIVSDR